MSGPTLDELRVRVHKERHQEIGNWLARRVGRPSAVYGTWVAVRLRLTAHQVTLGSLLTSLAGSIAIGLGSRAGFVSGVVLLHLAFWLDHVDGQVARWRGSASLDGVYLDYLTHHAANLALGFALGYGLMSRTGDPRWSIAGFLIALGWASLSLHNDCRYKAFFQRLKQETQSFRVDGGSGGRPRPPAPLPRQGPSAVSWLAYKACEPHVVLIALTVLAMLSFVPALWLGVWRVGVSCMAIGAPLLGLIRAARAVTRQTTEQEFAQWFRPWPEIGFHRTHRFNTVPRDREPCKRDTL